MKDNSLLPEEENKAVDRNLKGQTLEKQGDIIGAIELYELNVLNGFEGNFPYDRLRVIYSKQKRYDDVIRILEKAIDVFENKVFADRPDRLPKLEKFHYELEKAKKLK